ncbi:hypothetical protein SAMN05421837_107310 [Amycolatopsis pretoriensis]|uniref:Uncharacterized protein n=1 Tax=Amycolatopsis pretoriensis TaxID=218821 RepID=A0A1H5R9W4_9PSEU|nr:hypothetical protein [Amycolatopsis pretoriensis]SEF34298.1 hypothetical protein SAMN05421837_107310 [Amycolatopsis pretoriensis]
MTEEYTPMYAPENWPTHRMEVIRFASILADSIAEHGRHNGLTEFIRSTKDLPKDLMAGMIGMLLIDLHDHQRRDGETTLLSVSGDLWEEVTRVLGLKGLRIDPQPWTWRTDWPVYNTYAAHPVRRELPPEAGPSRTT